MIVIGNGTNGSMIIVGGTFSATKATGTGPRKPEPAMIGDSSVKLVFGPWI